MNTSTTLIAKESPPSKEDAGSDVAVREVVAVFEDPSLLDHAIASLGLAGVDRASISVMSSKETIDSKLGHLFRRVSASSDADDLEQGVEVTRYEMAEGMSALVAVPVYIGATAALIAIFATGGGMLAAALAGLAGGTVGGGFGAIAARALGRHHADHLEEQLRKGGLLLWVTVKDADDESAKIDLLRSVGGSHVHGHIYQRPWGVDQVPLHDLEPDPLLIDK